MSDNGNGDVRRPGGFSIPVKQEVAAGVFLALIGAFFVWQSSDLPMGTLRAVGPGMLPRAVAVMLVVGGLLLAIFGQLRTHEPLERFTWRGPVFIIGGIILFGLLIRTVGLIVAGPVAMIVASFASEETRIVETTIFGVVMTAACILLFKYLLNLPIPVIANWW